MRVLALALALALAIADATHEGDDGGGADRFDEEALLRPLADGAVLVHLQLTQRPLANTSHPRTFPRPVSDLVREVAAAAREVRLTLGRGRWLAHRWGRPPLASRPGGATLAASFMPTADTDAAWRTLTHKMGASFCSALVELAAPTHWHSPLRSPFPQRQLGPGSVHRTGTLPADGVCTENLTPWLKLLPCRDRQGVAALLQNRATLFQARYQMLEVRLSIGDDGEVTLTQTLTLVLPSAVGQPWTASSLLGTHAAIAPCPAATSSNLYMELEPGLLAASRNVSDAHDATAIAAQGTFGELHVSPAPHRTLQHDGRTLLQWTFDLASSAAPDVGVRWRTPLRWEPAAPTLHVSRYLTGTGTAKGGVAIELWRPESSHPPPALGTTTTLVHLTQSLPWFMRVYWHTLTLTVDGAVVPIRPAKHAGDLHLSPDATGVQAVAIVRPAEDRRAPGLLEVALALPPTTSTAQLTVFFEKAFLTLPEYPPDANHGFEVAAAVLEVAQQTDSDGVAAGVSSEWRVVSDAGEAAAEEEAVGVVAEQEETGCTLLRDLQATHSSEQICTEGLLVVLSVPDFSMPYNVITLTCTLVALLFGSVMNALVARRPEPDQPKRKKAAVGRGGWLRRLLGSFSQRARARNSWWRER